MIVRLTLPRKQFVAKIDIEALKEFAPEVRVTQRQGLPEPWCEIEYHVSHHREMTEVLTRRGFGWETR